MIYDCFIFNDELDLLELRLEFSYDYIDKFVVVESCQTLSGQPKPLYFNENKNRYKQFLEKIIYLECPKNIDLTNPWDYEFFQRNYIKEALKNCYDDDLIIISDVDELLDLKYVFEKFSFCKPAIVETDMYYYFLNLKAEYKWNQILVSPYRDIKTQNLGNRSLYIDLNPVFIKDKKKTLGWHFSYLFGNNVNQYQNKINSFSHQEFNNDYYLNPDRIIKCITLGIDIFERKYLTYRFKKLNKVLPKELVLIVNRLNYLNKLIQKRPSIFVVLKNKDYLKYFIKFNVIPSINHHLKLNRIKNYLK